ncbi:caspase family protein [Streptomyces rectiverticillatus]|uniref:caspase family protein n=1 Tax=Streptomyces rectiverticillatus TaxID=173860 RepID=UPI001FEC0576|nr:caspase family protein [Streptomyces rectiverticillatus]
MGRKFFIALGSGKYCHLPKEEQLASVPTDVRATTELFQDFGYELALPGLGDYESADQVRRKLTHWSSDVDLAADDVVVMYFAGHGSVEERDRHYLLCWDSLEDDLVSSALATEDLVRILCRGELRHLLLILDTCSAGVGNADAAAVALQTIAYRTTSDRASTGLWFLGSARHKDIAEDGQFVTALVKAVETTAERTGQRQQYLDLTELVKAINEQFDAVGTGQRAELASSLVTGLAPFLANSNYRDELPPLGSDLQVQRRVADRDLNEHFGPRSRGVEFESEQGLYFSGRIQVLSELVEWLTSARGDGHGRVVTGSPGCGKSAVLGRIVALSDTAYRSRLDLYDVVPSTVPPAGCVSAAVHARHKRLEEVVERIAIALDTQTDGPAALLQELTRRGRQGPPIIVVVDAVDEAGSDTAADAGGHGEPRRITRELLRPMSEIPGVRLLVGARHELVGPLGHTFTIMDLDQHSYRATQEDVSGYVARVLLADDEPDIPTPYRGQADRARTVACAVAEKAAGVYLYARTTARTLRSDRSPVDTNRLGWADDLPSEIGEAFDDYLARFGPDELRVRRMLLALAFSEGKGLPRGRVWTTLSSVISGVPCTEADVTWALDVAEAYVAEVIDDDQRSAYRLYHKALAEHLRATSDRTAEQVQRLIVRALQSLVTKPRDGPPDWFGAVGYVRRHLATHAAAGGVLSELVEDPGFLLASDPRSLLTAFASIEGDTARWIRSAYEQVAHRLTPERPLGDRAAELQLSARRCEADLLADSIENLSLERPWAANWAWWSTSGVHRLLAGHTRTVSCVAVGSLDGRPITVTGSIDGTARIWDLTAQQQIGDPMYVGIAVSAVAIGDLGDYTVAFTGGEDGTVTVWDLSAGQEYGAPLRGHTNRVASIAVGALHGHPVVLSASADGTARLWDLQDRRQLGGELTEHRRSVLAACLGELDGRPIAVTGGDDKAVYIWDLSEVVKGGNARVDGSPLIGPAMGVSAVCVSEVDGRTIALVGDQAGMLSRWDLHDRRQVGEPVSAHVYYNRSGVASATAGRLGGRPVAVTCGRMEARVWDIRTLQQLGPPLRGHVDDITAAALFDEGDVALTVTVSEDRTARIWDLTADQPAEGHARPVLTTAYHSYRGQDLAVTGGEDGSARLWDMATGQECGSPLEGHTGQVLAVAASEVGGSLIVATGGSDTTVRLWEPLRAGALFDPLLGHTNAVRCAAFGELDGRSILLTGSDDGTVRLWDTRDGSELCPPLAGHIGGIRYLAVRSGGQTLEVALCTSLSHGYLWRIGSGPDRPVTALHAHFDASAITSAARTVGVGFHQGRPVVVVILDGNAAHALDMETSAAIGGPYFGHTGFVAAAALGHIGNRTLLTTTSYDNTVRVWDLVSGAEEGSPLEGCTNLSPGSQAPPTLGRIGDVPVLIAVGSRHVRLWDLTKMQPLGEPLYGLERHLLSADIARAPDDRAVVVTGSIDGAVRVHDLDSGRQVAAHLTSGVSAIFGVATEPLDGDMVVVRSSWTDVDVWSVSTRRRLAKRAGYAQLARISVVEGRPVVIAVGGDYTLHAWDLATQAPTCPPMSGHTASVSALRAGQVCGMSIVASASLDGSVRLWDLRTGRPHRQVRTGYERGATALDLAVIGGCDHLVIGAGDGRVSIEPLNDHTPAGTELDRFPAPVRRVRVASMGGTPTLVAADQYGLVRVWDLEVRALRAEINVGSGINGVAVDEAGRICVATDMGLAALRLNLAAPTKQEDSR